MISGYEGSKPRQVLITAADLPRVLGGSNAEEDSAAEETVPAAIEGEPLDEASGEPESQSPVTEELPEPVPAADL